MLAPAELDALSKARRARSQVDAALRTSAERQLERKRYEATLAERQFNRVDPDNRLVAAELESRWAFLLENLPDRSVGDFRMTMRFGVGDAFVEQPGVHLVISLEPQTRREEALAHQTRLILDLALLPTRRRRAGHGFDEIAPARLEKAAIKFPVLADEDRLHHGFHIVVDAALARPSEKGERLEDQFLRLAQIGANKQHTAVTEPHIRIVDVAGRSAGPERLDPVKLGDLTLTGKSGNSIPLSQIGHIEIRPEEPILRRRDRTPTIMVQCDFDEALQPPQVSAEIQTALAPLIARLPDQYRIEMGGNAEESNKANSALAPIFPIMILFTLFVIVLQVRSLPAMGMVFPTAPLGLLGTVPILLLFGQSFGFNAILGLIGLSGILMRNTLILIGQIQTNEADGLDAYHAVIEATVQRARPVILTALTAALAFIPLTHSVFWGSMAYTLIGGTAVGTVLILLFLPALYAIWFKVKPAGASPTIENEHVASDSRPASHIS